MVSKSIAKFIKSLQLKKYRKQEQLFLVEGAKSVLEVLGSDFEVKQLLATTDFSDIYSFDNQKVSEIIEASPRELSGLGTLKKNDMALAVVKMKPAAEVEASPLEWMIALDDINDPGNMGTILRVADWYGIHQVVASEHTADFYNPKVIAASKGSFCRVKVFYRDLPTFLKTTKIPVYGAMLEGENVHEISFGQGGILVMGNEANGISRNIASLVSRKVTIPGFGQAESLNVAMATAVICDNIRRSHP